VTRPAWSLRLRLTLLFASVMAAVLVAAGIGLYVRLGQALDDSSEAEALEPLLLALVVAGPVVLALATLVAYWLAGAALRPVELMRREAAEISAGGPGRRLPVPAARDEIGRLAVTLNAMLDRLELALERERRFVADASHELRTPLASLRAELELALRRERPPAELRAALRSAAEETARLSQLAEDLLVLARADGGTLPLRRERVDIAALLGTVRERFAARTAQASRRLEVHAAPDLAVRGDRLRLEQALGNLVENALRHGGGTITMRSIPSNGGVAVDVDDEGDGFDDVGPQEAFHPFVRGRGSSSTVGAGLGLAIVEAIARAHGGSTHVASGPAGTTVGIDLPADM
jgi:signal transduction histidine kinase